MNELLRRLRAMRLAWKTPERSEDYSQLFMRYVALRQEMQARAETWAKAVVGEQSAEKMSNALCVHLSVRERLLTRLFQIGALDYLPEPVRFHIGRGSYADALDLLTKAG